MPKHPRNLYADAVSNAYSEARHILKIDWTSYDVGYWRRVFKRVYGLYGQSVGFAIVTRIKEDRYRVYRRHHPNTRSEVKFAASLVTQLLGYLLIGTFNTVWHALDRLNNACFRWSMRVRQCKDRLVSGKRPRR